MPNFRDGLAVDLVDLGRFQAARVGDDRCSARPNTNSTHMVVRFDTNLTLFRYCVDVCQVLLYATHKQTAPRSIHKCSALDPTCLDGHGGSSRPPKGNSGLYHDQVGSENQTPQTFYCGLPQGATTNKTSAARQGMSRRAMFYGVRWLC